MIFIDSEGKIKVWLNPNLSKNYSVQAISTGIPVKEKESPSQSEMVTNIITIIEENLDPLTISEPLFSDYLSGRSIFHRLSFDKALEELDNFTRISQLGRKDCMVSIANLYKEDLD